jgi:hypothetical protein
MITEDLDGNISVHNRRHVLFVNAGYYLYIYWYWLFTEVQTSTLCTVRPSRVRFELLASTERGISLPDIGLVLHRAHLRCR